MNCSPQTNVCTRQKRTCPNCDIGRKASEQRSTSGVQAIVTYKAQSIDLGGSASCIAMNGNGGKSDDAF
jgi:hypothetical protein